MIMFVCPKCNRQIMSIHGLVKQCECCKTQMIETKYDEEKVDITLKQLKEVIFNEYVKDNPLYDPEEAKRTEEYLNKRMRSTSYTPPKLKPKCPTCGSTNVQKIGTLERGVSVAAFGLFSGKLGKTMKCKNCGYKW